MFGTPASRTPLQSRELTGAILLALAVLAALFSVFVLTRPGAGDNASSPAAPGQVMPGMGSVMPEDVNVPVVVGRLDVAIGDYWFKAATARLRAGVYTLRARSYAAESHDIMIERAPIKFSAPGTPIDTAAPYGIDGMGPGVVKSTRIMLTAGRWELFCSVAGHYQAGQHQTITVYGPMPPGMTTPVTPGMGTQPSAMTAPSSPR